MRNLLCCLLLAACGSSSNNPAPDAAAATDSGSNAPTADASTLQLVTFTYTPGWQGVTGIDVVGGFDPNDPTWTTPLTSLTQSGNTWSGTAMVPAGTYPYLFHVTGDQDDSNPAQDRYVIDPLISSYIQCPDGTPTAGGDPNPCSQVTVPQTAAPTPYHIKGTVVKSGAAVAKWIVLVERQEASSHHFFANRLTTDASGNYDFTVAPGEYRIQVQHPQYESKKDTQLDPDTLQIVRRNISASFAVAAADVTLGNNEVAFTSYASFAPRTTATLPTAFTFTTGVSAKFEVYGYATTIGDPWYMSDPITTGTSTWDGAFNTSKKKQDKVDDTHTYLWGIEIAAPAVSGVKWTLQSMVYGVAFPTAT